MRERQKERKEERDCEREWKVEREREREREGDDSIKRKKIPVKSKSWKKKGKTSKNIWV